MSLTFEEVKEKLKEYPEDLLLEILDISSEDIVEVFEESIWDKIEELQEDLEDDESDDY